MNFYHHPALEMPWRCGHPWHPDIYGEGKTQEESYLDCKRKIMTGKITAEEVDAGQWTAWSTDWPDKKGYGTTQEEAKTNLLTQVYGVDFENQAIDSGHLNKVIEVEVRQDFNDGPTEATGRSGCG